MVYTIQKPVWELTAVVGIQYALVREETASVTLRVCHSETAAVTTTQFVHQVKLHRDIPLSHCCHTVTNLTRAQTNKHVLQPN